MVEGESASDAALSTIMIRLGLSCLNWFFLFLSLLSGPYSVQHHLFHLNRHPHSLYEKISSC